MEDAFWTSITEKLDESAPKLIFADWLEEQGDLPQALIWRGLAKEGHFPAQIPARVTNASGVPFGDPMWLTCWFWKYEPDDKTWYYGGIPVPENAFITKGDFELLSDDGLLMWRDDISGIRMRAYRDVRTAFTAILKGLRKFAEWQARDESTPPAS